MDTKFFCKLYIEDENDDKEFNNLTIDDLKDKISENTKRQKQVSNWGLSAKICQYVINELQCKKDKMITRMHELVDEL